ncbi:MAG: hypothetical protein IJU23_09535 [Proteobacteria bacterium]|nr:hypothetical protein [Pseudomonadota bacterium]
MHSLLRQLITVLFAGLFLFAISYPTDCAFAEEGKSGASANKNTKSGKKGSASKASNSKKAATKSSSSKSSSKGKSSKSKKKPKDRIDRAAEAASNSSKPIFSAEEIEQYKTMPYETWESPREVSELGLPIEPGFAQPYPYGNLMRQYCSTNSKHRGHDIGAIGEKNGGVGDPINAVTRSVVTFIGKTGENEAEFGKLDKRDGMAVRTGRSYPRQLLVPGYGLVYPFSLNYGRWHSGHVIVTRVLDGPLKDYTIRYMHLGAIRPDLKVGSIVEAGEHIAVMGGTSVLDSFPHLHLDMENPSGARASVAPYIGIPHPVQKCASAPLAKGSEAAQRENGDHNAAESRNKTKKTTKSSNSKKAKAPAKPKQRSRKAYSQLMDNSEPAQLRILERQSV